MTRELALGSGRVLNSRRVPMARMNLTEEVAAYFGVPRDIESWRFELFIALRNPAGYSAALATVDNAALYYALDLIDRAFAASRINIEHFVPADMEEALHDGLDDLRRRVGAEAAARGLSLTSYSSQVLN